MKKVAKDDYRSWRGIDSNSAHALWNARVKRTAKALDLEVHVGEPGDALTVRVDDLEELARKVKRLEEGQWNGKT